MRDGHFGIGVRRYARLSAEDERALLRRWQSARDETAMRRIVESFAPLVAKHAAAYSKYGLSREDMLQEGNLALVEAADRFDLTREVRFATYAAWGLRSAMQDYVLRNWSIVRLGTTNDRKSLFFKLRHVQARLAAAPGGDDDAGSVARAAAMLNMDRDEVARMDAMLRRGDHALNAPRAEDGDEWQTVLPDMRPDPESVAISAEDRRRQAALIAAALQDLSERERRIVVARKLGDDDGTPTLRDLGARLGISTERVRQIEHRAIEKMRRRLLEGGEDAAALLAEPGGRTVPGLLDPVHA